MELGLAKGGGFLFGERAELAGAAFASGRRDLVRQGGCFCAWAG